MLGITIGQQFQEHARVILISPLIVRFARERHRLRNDPYWNRKNFARISGEEMQKRQVKITTG